MNINAILKELGISKLKAAWTVFRKGVAGLIELLAKAFTAFLRKADPGKLEYCADLSARIARFINYGIELFVTDPKYKSAGMSTASGLEKFSKHIEDGEYTYEELRDDIDFIEECIDMWKEIRK